MPPIVNPRNERMRADQIIARGREFREDGPPLPAPGMPRGYVKMLMEERAARFIPGMPQQTRLVWGRCRKPCGGGECRQAGKCLAGGTIVLPCSRCWATEKIGANLTILGPLDDVLGVVCERCGGRDSEVQADLGTPPGYAEAMQRIAEWNAMVDQRRERRPECTTPFGWLPQAMSLTLWVGGHLRQMRTTSSRRWLATRVPDV